MRQRRTKGLVLLSRQPDSLRVPATAVVNYLAVHGAQSRAELAEALGWSRTKISRMTVLLLDIGLVVEQIEQPSGRGRPTARLQLDRGAGLVVGIDIGYRRLRTIVAAVDHTTLASDERVLSSEFDPDEAFTTAREMANELLQREALNWDDVVGAGIAVGAPIHQSSGAVTLGSLLPRWHGNLEQLSAPYFPCPTYVSNDSRLSAYAELLWGAGRRHRSFLYLKLHSGTGGSVIIDGRIHTGATGGAGEIGHFVVEPRGRFCRCGNRGCLETIVGVPAILDALNPVYPERPTWERFRELLLIGDPAATSIINNAYEVVGRAAASLANVLNPEAVILGGALSRATENVAELVGTSFERARLPINDHVSIEVGTIGRQAAALGAVGLVLTRGVA